MEEPAAEFASSLRDLTTNSKPLITMLTMIAEESKEHAAKIVEIIEDYLKTSEPHIKLPSLYLVDSIVKNIGEPYIGLFNENIVRNFLMVFREGDEKVRAALFKLRQTWKDIFTERKLYALDVNTQAVDPNWPVCAAAPIHLNPKFFKTHQEKPEIDIARKSETEAKSIEQHKKQLEKIQGDLKRKKDLLNQNAHNAAAQPKQSRDPRLKREHPSVTKAPPPAPNQTSQGKSEKDSKRPRRSKDRDKAKSESSSRKDTSVAEKTKPPQEKKFRIPKKSASASQKSSQENQAEKSPFRTSKVLEDPDASLMADKEAAAILTGDLDMRIFAPAAKRRREEPPANCDEDFRIRPTADKNSPARLFEKTETEGNAQYFKKEPKPELPVQKHNAQQPEWSFRQQQPPARDLDPLITQNGEAGKSFDSIVNQATGGVAPFLASSVNGLNTAPFGSRIPANTPVAEPAPDCGQIRLDGQMREIRFIDGVAIAIMDEAPPNYVSARQVVFRGSSRQIFINDQQAVVAGFDGRDQEFTVHGNRHRIRFGAPLRELYIDGVPYACQFDGRPMLVRSHDDLFTVTLPPPCPTVSNKLDAPPELLAKLGLRPMLPPTATMPRGPGPMGAGSGAGGAGDWRRYDGLPPSSNQGLPPGMYPTPPPPIPPNMALPPGGFLVGMLRPPPFRGSFGGPLLPPMPPMSLNGFPSGPVPPQTQTRPTNAPPVQMTSASSSANPMNVSDLFHKLLESGMLGKKDENSNDEKAVRNDDVKKEEVKAEAAAVREEIPRLNFRDTSILKKRYNGVISALHEGTQCVACGQRFQRSENNTDKYAQHLDWHFRMKRRGREGLKKATSRKWYFEISDWIDFEEVEDLDDRTKSFFEQQDSQLDGSSQDSQSSQTAQEVPTVALSALPECLEHARHSCELCHEVLDKFYCEESDDWRLRNAMLFDDKLFHPACHEDYMKPAPSPKPILVREGQDEPTEEEIADEQVKEEKAAIDEMNLPLPGLDFQPSDLSGDTDEQPKESAGKDDQNETPIDDSKGVTTDASDEGRVLDDLEQKKDEPILEDETQAMDAMIEHEVVIQELGEFGVVSSVDDPSLDGTNGSQSGTDQLNDTMDDSSQTSKTNEKVVVKGSGGFILKVNQESVANNKDSSQDATKDSKEASNLQELEIEWTPPSPDPRYKNLPLVKKGSEMSGLCSLM
ncbi:pre-mRNA cleavage complex 2 protein Pcf11 [Galendromus occidentalis]|uniref:Pre-mRNA cleavage complex 2 protein Pcf11 n=1 Tax=Galendromus occidentalis TaxID=34638 RepID=A0AAJ6VXQ6_9ACAR|nr:pre-mRNA cleavage complex 2 protein Pcf11 [Galendromus occidentalis]